MDLLHPRCAGLGVSKDAKVCVRVAQPGRVGAASTVTTWSAMTGQIPRCVIIWSPSRSRSSVPHAVPLRDGLW